MKTNIFVLVIRLQCVFIVFKVFSRGLQDVLQKILQYIFQTVWRRFKNVMQTSWRQLIKTSWQDFFNTFSRRIIKLVFSTFLRGTTKTERLQKAYLQKDFPGSHFGEIYGQGTKFSMINSLDIPKLLKAHSQAWDKYW